MKSELFSEESSCMVKKGYKNSDRSHLELSDKNWNSFRQTQRSGIKFLSKKREPSSRSQVSNCYLEESSARVMKGIPEMSLSSINLAESKIEEEEPLPIEANILDDIQTFRDDLEQGQMAQLLQPSQKAQTFFEDSDNQVMEKMYNKKDKGGITVVSGQPLDHFRLSTSSVHHCPSKVLPTSLVLSALDAQQRARFMSGHSEANPSKAAEILITDEEQHVDGKMLIGDGSESGSEEEMSGITEFKELQEASLVSMTGKGPEYEWPEPVDSLTERQKENEWGQWLLKVENLPVDLVLPSEETQKDQTGKNTTVSIPSDPSKELINHQDQDVGQDWQLTEASPFPNHTSNEQAENGSDLYIFANEKFEFKSESEDMVDSENSFISIDEEIEIISCKKHSQDPSIDPSKKTSKASLKEYSNILGTNDSKDSKDKISKISQKNGTNHLSKDSIIDFDLEDSSQKTLAKDIIVPEISFESNKNSQSSVPLKIKKTQTDRSISEGEKDPENESQSRVQEDKNEEKVNSKISIKSRKAQDEKSHRRTILNSNSKDSQIKANISSKEEEELKTPSRESIPPEESSLLPMVCVPPPSLSSLSCSLLPPVYAVSILSGEKLTTQGSEYNFTSISMEQGEGRIGGERERWVPQMMEESSLSLGGRKRVEWDRGEGKGEEAEEESDWVLSEDRAEEEEVEGVEDEEGMQEGLDGVEESIQSVIEEEKEGISISPENISLSKRNKKKNWSMVNKPKKKKVPAFEDESKEKIISEEELDISLGEDFTLEPSRNQRTAEKLEPTHKQLMEKIKKHKPLKPHVIPPIEITEEVDYDCFLQTDRSIIRSLTSGGDSRDLNESREDTVEAVFGRQTGRSEDKEGKELQSRRETGSRAVIAREKSKDKEGNSEKLPPIYDTKKFNFKKKDPRRMSDDLTILPPLPERRRNSKGEVVGSSEQLHQTFLENSIGIQSQDIALNKPDDATTQATTIKNHRILEFRGGNNDETQPDLNIEDYEDNRILIDPVSGDAYNQEGKLVRKAKGPVSNLMLSEQELYERNVNFTKLADEHLASNTKTAPMLVMPGEAPYDNTQYSGSSYSSMKNPQSDHQRGVSWQDPNSVFYTNESRSDFNNGAVALHQPHQALSHPSTNPNQTSSLQSHYPHHNHQLYRPSSVAAPVNPGILYPLLPSTNRHTPYLSSSLPSSSLYRSSSHHHPGLVANYVRINEGPSLTRSQDKISYGAMGRAEGPGRVQDKPKKNNANIPSQFKKLKYPFLSMKIAKLLSEEEERKREQKLRVFNVNAQPNSRATPRPVALLDHARLNRSLEPDRNQPTKGNKFYGKLGRHRHNSKSRNKKNRQKMVDNPTEAELHERYDTNPEDPVKKRERNTRAERLAEAKNKDYFRRRLYDSFLREEEQSASPSRVISPTTKVRKLSSLTNEKA